MNAIETAIQSASNAATAHGFVQALEQVTEKLRGDAERYAGNVSASGVLIEVADAIAQELAKRKPQLEQLQTAARQAAFEALRTTPDMSKVRAAMAVILGAG